LEEYQKKATTGFKTSGVAFVSFTEDMHSDRIEKYFELSTVERLLAKVFCPGRKAYKGTNVLMKIIKYILRFYMLRELQNQLISIGKICQLQK